MNKLDENQAMSLSRFTKRILRHVRQDGDCWEWTGSVAHGMTPIARVKVGGAWTCMPVRRAILLMQDANIDGVRAAAACKNKLCVNPAHVAVK